MSRKIIIGTRGSDLALWQANFLAAELNRHGHDTALKIIKTQGDKIQHVSLEKLEGKGFFTKEIEDALLENAIDIAVHSHKDLPTEFTKGLCIAAVSEREDCSELLLIRKECVDILQEFDVKKNAVIGTSSARRNVQLKFFRKDIICRDIRGNVPTRIQKLRTGDFDAILLAYAGVHRLGLDTSDLHTVKIEPEKLIPAPAQGVLAFQCRENDEQIKDILQKIHHPEVQETISIERDVLKLFQGGCHMPLGVYCKKDESGFHCWAAQAADKETALRRLYFKASSDKNLAITIYNKLHAESGRAVFITKPIDPTDAFATVLHAAGYSTTGRSFVAIEPISIAAIPACTWLFFTSSNGVRYFFDQVKDIADTQMIAAIGKETAAAVRAKGHITNFTGNGDIESTAKAFSDIAQGSTVCFPQALHAKDTLMQWLDHSITVVRLPVYSNSMHPFVLPEKFNILVFTSPLNADGYLALNTIEPTHTIIAIGKTTQEHLQQKGFSGLLIPPVPGLLSIAELISGL